MGKKVLVADDSSTIQKAFNMVFGGLQDSISLVPARNFDEAMSLARQGRPDLVVADIALGNRTGYELCAALKSEPALRGVPVYILGSSQTPYDEAKGRQSGADGHLLKPFESQSLIDRVHEALAKPASAGPAARPEPSAPPVASARPLGVRPAAPVLELDDEYGEFTIERSSSGSAPRPAPAAFTPTPSSGGAGAHRPGVPAAVPISPFAPAPTAAVSTTGVSTGSGAALRPSLIPGARPMPPARPAAPSQPGGGVASASASPPTAAVQRPGPAAPVAPSPGRRPEAIPPAPPAGPDWSPRPAPQPGLDWGVRSEPGGVPSSAPPGMGRTIMGLPAVAIPGTSPIPREARPAPATIAPPAIPAAAHAPAPATVTPIAPARPPAASIPAPLAPVPSAEPAALVSARIDQKVAAIAARGPEYEAVARLSREVIEQVVWEVVPELAEIIIREHVERLASARK